MNAFIRKHKKTIFWILFVVITFATFAYFGAGGVITKGADTVATVNSKKLSYAEYERLSNRVINNQREQKKEGSLSEEEIKNLKLEVLRNMISEEAFCQEAEKYGLAVSDNEIAAYLQQIPAFQKNGKFDHQTYFQTLRYGIKMSAQEFEESRRRMMLNDRVRFIIALTSKVTEKEAADEYLRRNGNMKNWDKEKDKFIGTMEGEKSGYFQGQWVNKLQQTAKIKEFLSKFEKM